MESRWRLTRDNLKVLQPQRFKTFSPYSCQARSVDHTNRPQKEKKQKPAISRVFYAEMCLNVAKLAKNWHSKLPLSMWIVWCHAVQKDLGQGPSRLPMSLRWPLCCSYYFCWFTAMQLWWQKQLRGEKVILKGWGSKASERGRKRPQDHHQQSLIWAQTRG